MINDIAIDNTKINTGIPHSSAVVFNKINGVFALATLSDYSADGSFTGHALAQKIALIVRFWRGDWFLDKTFGVPGDSQVGQLFESTFLSASLAQIEQLTEVLFVKVDSQQVVEGVLTISFTLQTRSNGTIQILVNL